MGDKFVDPTREVFAELKQLPLDHPVDMLNLVRLNETCVLPDGNTVTGSEAYASYGKESQPIFQKVGGEIIWSGDPQLMVIGSQDEAWDIAFIARYPTGQAFVDMVYNPAYRAIVHYRQAAVMDSRLIRMKPRDSGSGFGT